MKIVVSLAEGSYFQGACVLFNSLAAHGFQGTFVAGCRSLEDVPERERSAIEAYRRSGEQGDGPQWEWFPVETHWHFTNYKPRFMQMVLEAYPECRSIVYLDPDIVVCSPWHWMEEAMEFGPVVAADVNWWLPKDHPTRHTWMLLIEQADHRCTHGFDLYFNGGLLGLLRCDGAFLDLWHQFIDLYGASGNPLDGQGDIDAWRGGGRWNAMHTPDQDALNLAAMAWPQRMSTFGPDLMGFSVGWIGLPHALGPAKPWRRHYLREALAGRPPRRADKEYWAHASGPIHPYPSLRVKLTSMRLNLAAFIGRFYRRR